MTHCAYSLFFITYIWPSGPSRHAKYMHILASILAAANPSISISSSEQWKYFKRIAMISSKYDSAYRNSENENRLPGRSLTLGQICGIISVCLYGPDIPMEVSFYIRHILHILHIVHISNWMTYSCWSLYHRTCRALGHPQICCMVFTDRRGIGWNSFVQWSACSGGVRLQSF